MKSTILVLAVAFLSGCASQADVRGYSALCAKHGGLVYINQIFALRDGECVDGTVVKP